MQLGSTVERIKRGATAVRLKVDRVPGPNKRCHIGNCVRDHEFTTRATRNVQGLIKITRAGGIDGDQVQIRTVKIRKLRLGSRLLSGSLDLDRKVRRHFGDWPNGR